MSTQHTEPTSTPDPQKVEGHHYDGIEELDNSLPSWWINGFYLTIIFSLGYFFYYSLYEGPSLLKEYKDAKNAFEYTQSLQQSLLPVAAESELRTFLKDPTRIKTGKNIFQEKCSVCHGAQGQGGIGPNLTDDYWIHGGSMSQILKVVTYGIPDKGMQPWGPILKPDELYSVVTFIKSLRGSHPPGAKAPQGELLQE